MNITLLAIDDHSLPLRKNTCLYLNKPAVRHEPVLVPEPAECNAPDNLAIHFYGTVLHDNGKFRMWYYACHRGENPDWPPEKKQQIVNKPGWLIGIKEGYEVYQGPICYAESDDGINWIKPDLGQVLFKGNYQNNAIDLPHTLVSGAAVIRDDDDPDLEQRYKMIYQYFPDQTEPQIPEYGNSPSIACAISPDGIRWKVTAIPFINQFVEHCSFIKHNHQYIIHSQVFPGNNWSAVYNEGGTAGGRTGVAHCSYDFDNWPDLWARSFALPEPVNPENRGADYAYDQVHLGVGAASLGNVCVGIYGLWHSAAFGESFADISCDLGLVVSNDGIHFREPGVISGQVFINHNDSLATPAQGHDFNTILCQGNGIVNVDDETRIYHGRWRNAGQKAEDISEYYYAEVALATLPRDRWGHLTLNPDTNAGAICSAPVDISDGIIEISINADGTENITVDLLDNKMHPIDGFTNGKINGADGLNCPVKWEHKELNEIKEQQIRIKLKINQKSCIQAKVYAVYINPVRK